MDIVIPIMFFIFGFFTLIIGLFEERDEKNSDDEQERSDNLVVILLLFSTIFWFIAGICMMSVTETYYDLTTDTIQVTWLEYQRPVGWIGVITGIFVLYLLIKKGLSTLDIGNTDEVET